MNPLFFFVHSLLVPQSYVQTPVYIIIITTIPAPGNRPPRDISINLMYYTTDCRLTEHSSETDWIIDCRVI